MHRVLLVEAGVHIIEHLNLEEAARQRLTEFAFLMAPLRIVGGTGSPVRPVAVMAAGPPTQPCLTVVQRLAQLAHQAQQKGLDQSLREDVTRRLLDVLGNSLAATEQPSARSVTRS